MTVLRKFLIFATKSSGGSRICRTERHPPLANPNGNRKESAVGVGLELCSLNLPMKTSVDALIFLSLTHFESESMSPSIQ